MCKTQICAFVGTLVCAFIGIVPTLRAQITPDANGVVFVKETANKNSSGNSWSEACSLSEALNAAKSNKAITNIWVAVGSYTPQDASGGSVADARDKAFFLVDGIKMYGGFVGNETFVSQRPSVETGRAPLSSYSVLSGDLDNDGKVSSIDAYHVLVGAGLSSNTVIDGFKISGGNANGGEDSFKIGQTDTYIRRYNGGGIYLTESSPTFTNLLIDGNKAMNGGGIYIGDNSSPTFTNLLIDGNTAMNGGGGIYSYYSTPKFINSLITNNTAKKGSAIYNDALHIPATSITVEPKTLELDLEQSYTLKAHLLPTNANSPVTWSSRDPSYATVDVFGKVTALKKTGKVKIYADAEGKRDSCEVTVRPIGPYIEIYLGKDGEDNLAGETLRYLYDDKKVDTFRISAKVFNVKSGFDNLEWTISIGAVRDSILTLPQILEPKPNGVFTNEPNNKTAPQLSNGTSFKFAVGKTIGEATLTVQNTNEDGKITSEYIKIATVEASLPELTVYVTEKIQRTNLGSVVFEGTAFPTWSVRSGNAALSVLFPSRNSNSTILEIFGVYAGSTIYFASGLQKGPVITDLNGNPVLDAQGNRVYEASRTVETGGSLKVEASTTWYVGPNASKGYGFRNSDLINWGNCLNAMRNYYTSPTYHWPEKGRTLWEEQAQTPGASEPPPPIWVDNEQHGVIRLTVNETEGLALNGTYYPVHIDLVSEPLTAQRTLSGVVTVFTKKILTLTGIEITGTIEINGQAASRGQLAVPGSQDSNLSSDVPAGYSTPRRPGVLTMMSGAINNVRTEVKSGGELNMNGGTLKSSVHTKVFQDGELKVTAGEVTGKVEISGADMVPSSSTARGLARAPGIFTMEGGTLKSEVTVQEGGDLIIKAGTIVYGTVITVESGGKLEIWAGTIGYGTEIVVKAGGKLEIRTGTIIENGAVLTVNGSSSTAPGWPSLTYTWP
ncbi:hypothetical protein FACS1894195_0740 [Bacteroidia bacterium]|nr:hypothetical protein FACS1894195_0740 [Bacteroidia bacterium]